MIEALKVAFILGNLLFAFLPNENYRYGLRELNVFAAGTLTFTLF